MELSRLMLACVVKCYSNAIPSQRDNGSDAKHGLIGEAAQILHDPVDCSPSGSSVHGILQERVVGWVYMLYCA